MNTKKNYNTTVFACFIGFLIQGVLNNFAPLLFITFQKSYGLTLDKIATLVTINFGTQVVVDFLCTKFIDKIGYRASAICAHVMAFIGLFSLAVLPELCRDPFVGIVIAVMIYAIGSGIIEVALSPIVEACPVKKKSAVMSLLHSFYCWGHVFTILISTAYFAIFGIENWKVLAMFWSFIPLLNCIMFFRAPIVSLSESGRSLSMKKLVVNPTFWILMILMVCSGASEQCISQWVSSFAEAGLNIPKAVGDIFGTCMFAVMMGISRVIYGKNSDKMDLSKYISLSAVACFLCYLIAALSKNPVVSLIGCILCGFTVGILWPGTYSTSTKKIPLGGTSFFALLALAGDVGCASGPGILGYVSSYFSNNLKIGILVSAIFPLLIIIFMRVLKRR